MITKITRSEAEWKALLTPEQFRVLREHGTEAPFSCAWTQKHFGPGTFNCVACDLPLFMSETKFESGTGWPSYFEPFQAEHIEEKVDDSLGMRRTEVRCARCDSHLGHVFDDGPPPSFKRYCMNSVALQFKEQEQ